MRIGFKGELTEEKEIRAGYIGCGSHGFRNVLPTFQFAPVELVATCDIQKEKAEAFARKFGARAAYANHLEMIEKEDLDAVFMVLPYKKNGQPLYPDLVVDCLNAGCHTWIEKPPAGSCADVERMREASRSSGKYVLSGMKKMFFPANEKAAELMADGSFGPTQLVSIQYPQRIPPQEEFDAYAQGTSNRVVGFLDHLCHPTSLMVSLLGMPRTLYFERSSEGAGVATFTYASGTVATLLLTHGGSINGGMERTLIVSSKGQHIVVDNNVRVSLHKKPAGIGYGKDPDFYRGKPEDTGAFWEPEFSLGNLYNKGLFLLGYYNEVNEFARAILEDRAPVKGSLDHIWMVTRIFEAFFEGPGKVIELGGGET